MLGVMNIPEAVSNYVGTAFTSGLTLRKFVRLQVLIEHLAKISRVCLKRSSHLRVVFLMFSSLCSQSTTEL